MEALLRKVDHLLPHTLVLYENIIRCLSSYYPQVDADFLAMIKEAEDDESKAAESSPMEGNAQDIMNEEK